MGLSLSLLPAGTRLGVVAVWRDLGLERRSNGELFVLLKELGELAKHHGDVLFGPLWPFLVDWQLSFGAEPTTGQARAEFKELLRAWVFDPKPEDVEGSMRENIIMRGLAKVREELMPLRRMGLPWDEWVRSPSRWLVNGASTVEGLPGTRKNKFSTYLGRTDAELRHDLLDTSDPHYHVFDKRERGKHRNLVSAPWSLYVQMSFLGDVGENLIYSHIPTSLSKEFGLEHWLGWQSLMGQRLMVPVDQSKFDHVPSGRVLDAAFKLIVDICCVAGDVDRIAVGKLLLRRLRHGTISYEDLELPHRRGVLSGWRWTALIDTVINYAEYLGLCEEIGVPPAPKDQCCFQGDDALFPVSGWSAAAELVEAYRAALPVNPAKFFLRFGETEYLRLVLTPQKRFGYFARVASGLMYANAWSGGKLDASSIAATWSTVAGRGADMRACKRRCAADLSGMLRCRLEESWSLLGTPAAVGGLGFWDFGAKRWMKLVTPKVVEAGARKVQGTAWGDLPDLARQRISGVLSERLQIDVDDVADVAEQLVTGLEVKGGRVAAEERSFVARAERDVGTLPRNGLVLPTPRALVDAMFLRGLLRTRMRRGDASWLELFHVEDRGRVQSAYRSLPRSLWFDWATGGLSAPVGKRFGDAGDVLRWIRSSLDARGYLPVGNCTTARYRLRQLRLEWESACAFVDLRSRMRA
jgi:hypothetical protein